MQGEYSAKLEFQQFAAKVEGHAACHHAMFEEMRKLAEEKKLTQAQVDVFTGAMMARIYRTIPNIAGLVQTGMLTRNEGLAKTAMENLQEEMGGGGKTHQQLAEDAFNALRQAFQLPKMTLLEAHSRMPLPESYVQEEVWVSAYRDFPAVASWLQEKASGGSGADKKGMMGDMFGIFEACRPAMGEEAFRKEVLPYFKAHNTVEQKEGRYRIVFDAHAVEHQHGVRAEKDACEEYCRLAAEQRKVVERKGEAFLKVQADLFGAILPGVRGAMSVA